jgi:Zn-dependent protease with chaperone function
MSCGIHPASCPLNMASFFLRVEAARHDTTHLPPPSAKNLTDMEDRFSFWAVVPSAVPWLELFTILADHWQASLFRSCSNDLVIFCDTHLRIFRRISTVKPTRCNIFSNLFYFGIPLYMFWMVFPFIRSSWLYIQQQVYVKQILLSACAVLNSWWWTERLSKICRVVFQNKINLRTWCVLLVLL